MRQHADFAGQCALVMFVEAARCDRRADDEQRVADRIVREDAGLLDQPGIPRAYDQIVVGDDDPAVCQLVEPLPSREIEQRTGG